MVRRSALGYKERVKISVVVAWILFLSGHVFSQDAGGFGWLSEEVPVDERTAYIEQEEGAFDSASWDRLEPFYIQPLSVPLGELRYLRDIFPDLPDDLPVDAAVLAGYVPWTADNIAVFFRDYPYLAPFRSILSFETDRVSSIGRIACFSRLSGFSHTFYQSLRFSATPVSHLRADGTISFEETYARWRRRRLLVTVPHVGTIQLGNFSFTMNRGLFYGYFPASPAAGDSVAYNWLYGTSRTWNGLSSKTACGRAGTVYTMVHHRTTESVAGVKAVVQPGSAISCYSAVSGAFIDTGTDANDTTVTVHGGISASLGSFDFSLESGSPLVHATGAPVYVTLSHGKKGGNYSLSYIRMPARFYAPRSSLLHSFYARLDIEDRSADALTGIAFSVAGSWLHWCRQRFTASYITEGTRADCRAVYTLQGDYPCSYALRYSLSVNNYEEKVLQRATASLAYDPGSFFSITAALAYTVRTHDYHRLRVHCEPCVKLFSSLFVSPFITYSSSSTAGHDLVVGIGERVNLFAQSFGEVTCSVPVISAYDEEYSLYAKVHFLF